MTCRAQCGIGIVTKSAAELNKRGDSFYNELDFVFANVVMAIIADYMLCYLPAPTISFAYVVVLHQHMCYYCCTRKKCGYVHQ